MPLDTWFDLFGNAWSWCVIRIVEFWYLRLLVGVQYAMLDRRRAQEGSGRWLDFWGLGMAIRFWKFRVYLLSGQRWDVNMCGD